MSAHVQAQLVRAARLLTFVLTAQPVAAALVSSAWGRDLLTAAQVVAAELAVRQVFPVKPLPRVASEPAAPPSPPGAAP